MKYPIKLGACEPEDIISGLEEKKNKILATMEKGVGSSFFSAFTSGLVDALTNSLTSAIGGAVVGLVNNLVDKAHINEALAMASSIIVAALTITDQAKLFFYELYIEGLKQTLKKRIKLANELDDNIITMINFLNVWGYIPSTEQWNRLNNSFQFVKKADKQINLVKNELDNSERLLFSAYRAAGRNIERAEKSYVTSVEVTPENAAKHVTDALQSKWEAIITSFNKYIDALMAVFGILPIDRTVMSQFVSGAVEIGLSIFGTAAAILVKTPEDKTAKKLSKLLLGLFNGNTLVSANQMIRKNIKEIRDFDPNFEALTKINRTWLHKIIDKINSDIRKLKDNMNSDLSLDRSSNIKLAGKNTIHTVNLRLLRGLFESSDTFVLEHANMQNTYDVLAVLENKLRQYPDEHPLEKVVDNFIVSLAYTVEGIWDDFGSARAVVELNNIRRLLRKGLQMDNELLQICDNLNILEIPLFNIAKNTAAFNDKRNEIIKNKKKFTEFMANAKTFFAQSEQLGYLNALTGIASVVDLKEAIGFSLPNFPNEECKHKSTLEMVSAATAAPEEPGKIFAKSYDRFKAAVENDITVLKEGWGTFFKDTDNIATQRTTK